MSLAKFGIVVSGARGAAAMHASEYGGEGGSAGDWGTGFAVLCTVILVLCLIVYGRFGKGSRGGADMGVCGGDGSGELNDAGSVRGA